MTVPASLVRRSKNHFHNLPCGASVILGNNGYIWISPLVTDDHTQDGSIRFQTPSNPAASSVETTTKVNNTHTHTHVHAHSLTHLLNCYCLQPVTLQTRETIARLRNCIVALARQKVMLFDTTIVYTHDESLKHKVRCEMFTQYLTMSSADTPTIVLIR